MTKEELLQEIAAMRIRLDSLEKAARALDKNECKSTDSVLAECRRFCAENQTIRAVKLYRSHFGTGLKEAHDAVQALLRGNVR